MMRKRECSASISPNAFEEPDSQNIAGYITYPVVREKYLDSGSTGRIGLAGTPP